MKLNVIFIKVNCYCDFIFKNKLLQILIQRNSISNIIYNMIKKKLFGENILLRDVGNADIYPEYISKIFR